MKVVIKATNNMFSFKFIYYKHRLKTTYLVFVASHFSDKFLEHANIPSIQSDMLVRLCICFT